MKIFSVVHVVIKRNAEFETRKKLLEVVSCSGLNLHISRVLSCSARIIPKVTYLVVPNM